MKPTSAKPKKDPCWEGYVQKGMKTKNGKKVPNCIPDKKKTKNKLHND